MKLTAALFLLFQLADALTTAAGLSLGLGEANPLALDWWRMWAAKAIAAVGIALILQIKRSSRLDWIPVVISGVVIPWNILNILVVL